MRVDVVTAAHGPYARYLPAAWSSLRRQTHQDWRWVVQVDGPDAREVRAALRSCGAAADPRISLDAHRATVGPANTRNLALGRSDAPLVQNLDADDELEPSALAALSRALLATPETGYAVGQARDLLPDGRLRSVRLPLRPGPIARGALVEHWPQPPAPYRVPVHPAGVMYRRDLLEELGPWQALEGMEDTGLLMAVSARAAGVLIGSPTLRYRRHTEQLSRRTSDFSGGGVQMSLIRRRALRLLAAPAWSPPPQPPIEGPRH